MTGVRHQTGARDVDGRPDRHGPAGARDSWEDLLPWLRDPDGGATWDVVPAPVGSPRRLDQLAEVAGFAREHRATLRMGDLVDALPDDADLRSLSLGARVANALARRGIDRWQELADLALADVVRWRQIGPDSVDELLVALVRAHLGEIMMTSMDERPTSTLDVVPDDDEHAAELLDRAVLALARRPRDAAVALVRPDTRPTSRAMAADIGVSLTHLHQLLPRARAALLDAVAASSALRAMSDAVVGSSSHVRSLDVALADRPRLADPVASVDAPVWRVLERIQRDVRVVDRWCVSPDFRRARLATLARLDELVDGTGLVRVRQLDVIADDDLERRDATTLAWLRRCGAYVADGFAARRPPNLAGRAVHALRLIGCPASSATIASEIAEDTNRRSVEHVLRTSPHIVRVGRSRWALAEWGLPAYDSIRASIAELVSASGGEALLADVVQTLGDQHDVAAASVRSYAAAAPFEIEGGVVRIAQTIGSVPSVEHTRHLYRRPSGCAYRIVITKYHLAGSGSTLPRSLPAHLGIAQGTARSFASGDTEVIVTRRSPQSAISTLRPWTRRLGLQHGDVVLLDFAAHSMEVVPIRAEPGDPREAALALVGARIDDRWGDANDDDAVRAAIAYALWFDENAAWADLVARCRRRGEHDLAALLGRLAGGAPRPVPPAVGRATMAP